MARIRTLKPECWQDEALGAVSRDARLLFIGLITQADDEGRLRGAPALVKAQVFPYDPTAPDSVERWLSELDGRELIVRYESKGEQFIALPGWAQNQKISHPSPSILPSPPEGSGAFLVGKDRKGKDRSTSSNEDVSAQIQQVYDHWFAALGKNGRTSLTDDRRTKIKARLGEFSVDDLKLAIDGVLRSDWHMGRHEKTRDKPCNDFATIFRNAQQVNKFIELAEKKGANRERRYTRPEAVSG